MSLTPVGSENIVEYVKLPQRVWRFCDWMFSRDLSDFWLRTIQFSLKWKLIFVDVALSHTDLPGFNKNIKSILYTFHCLDFSGYNWWKTKNHWYHRYDRKWRCEYCYRSRAKRRWNHWSFWKSAEGWVFVFMQCLLFVLVLLFQCIDFSFLAYIC